ncbi:hypothetical protein FACS1894191_1660 [Clostridia bacterium]|nr:hypothetical protein FACS1894191_1660 [Clostridia bacterium]
MRFDFTPASVFLGLALACFATLLTNTIIYFNKSRSKDTPNRIFNVMVLAGFINIILDIACHFFAQNMEATYPIGIIVAKSYATTVAAFSCIMTLYVVAIDGTKTAIPRRRAVKRYIIALSAFLLSFAIVAAFTDLKVFYDGAHAYSYGFLIDSLLAPSLIIMMLFWLYKVIKNLKMRSREIRRRFTPVITFLALYLITVVVQGFVGKWALLLSLNFTVIIIITMSTIENPELKIIRSMNILEGRLKRADKAKDEFMSLASHQLRTPLTSVNGYSSMLLEGDFGRLNHEQAHAVNEIAGSAGRMAFLVSDLLNVSRIQSGKFLIQRTPTDMKKLVESEVESLQILADSHSIELNLKKIAPNLPLLNIDEKKVGEVMANMLDNAIFYSPEKKPIEVSLVEKAGWLEFRVKDHGIGVPKSEQEDLFTKFFRATNARTKRPDGTGIGLFLAKKVITEQKGEIIFHSTPGEGSTFGFRFPIVDQEAAIK